MASCEDLFQRKLALDLEKHFDPEGTTSVLIEEGIAMTYDFA